MLAALTARRGLHYALVVAAAASIAVTATLGFGRFSYPLILPSMQQGLGLTSAQSGLLASSNLLGYLIASAAGGVLTARLGARRLITLGLGLTVLGLLLSGLAAMLEIAMVGQWLTGLGGGAATVPAVGLTASWFGPAYRGRASGVIAAGPGPGMLVAGLLLPGLIAASGWRVGWLCLAGLVAAIALLGWAVLRDHPHDLGLLAFGQSRPAHAAPRSPAKRWHTLLRARPFWQLGLLFGLFGLGSTAYATFFPAYLASEAGFSQAAAGALWSVIGVLGAIGALVWGGVSDALGRRLALAAVFACFVAAFSASALAPGPLGHYAAPLLFGLTFWATPTIIGAAAGDFFGETLVFASFGLLAVFSALGQAIGPGLAGWSADVTGSFTGAFVVAATSSLAALALSLTLPRGT